MKAKGSRVDSMQCPKCADVGKDRSKDNLQVYDLGNGDYDGYCFSCGAYFPSVDIANKEIADDEDIILTINEDISLASLMMAKSSPIADRGITQATTEKYGVKEFGGKRYYPRTTDGEITGYKCRKLPKEFSPRNGANPVGSISTTEMFGQSVFSKGKWLIITEGEEDAMAAYQITKQHGKQGDGYASVSISDGAGSLIKTINENQEYINKFEKVIFALDQEKEVQESVKKAAKLLPPRKAFIAKFSEKDASDMLKKGKTLEFAKAIWNAEEYKPEGIVSGNSTWEIFQSSKHSVIGLPLPDKFGLNDKYLGMVKGNLDVIGAFEKAGKSTLIKEIVIDLRLRHQQTVGLFMLEEFIEETVGDLMSMDLETRIDLNRNAVSEKLQKESWAKLFGDNQIMFSDAHSFLTIDDFLSKIRYMKQVYGVEYFFIDNLTKISRILVHEKDNENFVMSKIMTELERLCKDLEIYICLVSHVRKEDSSGGRSYTEGKIMRVHDLYGSGDVSKSAYNVIAIARDNSNDPNITQYHLIASRRGKLGFGNRLTFDFDSARMITINEDCGEDIL